jgi:tetratricopeptide (TPR) repeat protein
VQPVAKLEQRGLPQAKTPEPLLIQKEADETIKSEITKAASTGGIVGVPVDQNQTSTEEIKTTVITGSKVGKSGQDDDCSRADQEYQRANTSISDADKLFYLRRALRLCSSKANFHLATGKVYAKLGRTEDAEYEFRQVLDLESNNAEATKELASLKQGTR